MKIVLDTNVLMSAIFFTGPPHEILKSWRDGRTDLLVSTDVLNEYERVAEKLAREFPAIDASGILDLIVVGAEIVEAPPLPKPVCSHPEDDKFLACAVAGSAGYIVTGDKQLLKVSRYGNVEILSSRRFLEMHLGA